MYKALVTDLDGTAIPLKQEASPSEAVVNAISWAKKHIHVCGATGRPMSNGLRVLDELGIDSLSIMSGGTQIVDPKTQKVAWEKKLESTQVEQVLKVCAPYPYEILFNEELLGKGAPARKKEVKGDERVIYIMNIREEDGDKILQGLKGIEGIAAHDAGSWTPGFRDIHVTHELGTKSVAFQELIDLLGVRKSETIAVGDADNDGPLLEEAGLKVAMGNASAKLKSIADVVAPTIDDDGLVWVIESYVVG